MPPGTPQRTATAAAAAATATAAAQFVSLFSPLRSGLQEALREGLSERIGDSGAVTTAAAALVEVRKRLLKSHTTGYWMLPSADAVYDSKEHELLLDGLHTPSRDVLTCIHASLTCVHAPFPWMHVCVNHFRACMNRFHGCMRGFCRRWDRQTDSNSEK